MRVLVVDLDPQGSATQWLGGHEVAKRPGRVLCGRRPVVADDRQVDSPGYRPHPDQPSLVLSGESGRNETGFAIVRGFVRLPEYWDILLVDTPPTLGYLSLAPLVACDRVVIPVEPHALGLPGVASVIASIERARQRINPKLEALGIVACRVDATSHTRKVVERLRSQFGTVVLDHTVREAVQIAEAPGACAADHPLRTKERGCRRLSRGRGRAPRPTRTVDLYIATRLAVRSRLSVIILRSIALNDVHQNLRHVRDVIVCELGRKGQGQR